MTELKEIYERYFATAFVVRAKASPLAGIWGMGKDPRNDRCHEEFYDAVKDWVARFDGDSAEAAAAVRWILTAAQEHKANKDVYWYLFAAHGLTLPLIPRLDPAECRELFAWYDGAFPKKDRLPLQQQVWKALKKCAK